MSETLKSTMRKAAVVAMVALGLLLAGQAEAATLYISEFASGVSQGGTTTAQTPPQIAVTDQTVALSGSSALSSAFNSKTNAVTLMCDEGCSIKFGTTNGVAATTSNYLLQQGVYYRYGAAPGWFVAAIANAAGNTPGGGAGTPTDVTIVGPLGQATSAASVPVVIASDQSAIPVSQASQPLPTGAATSANQTNASQKTQIVDGSGNVAGSQSFGAANFLNVTTPDELGFTGTAAAAVAIPIIIPSVNGGLSQPFIDMSGYESISVQVTGAGSATTLTYEGSDDNATWQSTSGLISTAVGASNPTVNSTASGLYSFPKHGRYFRIRVSTYGSGTVTIVGNLHKNPQPLTNRITVDGPGATNATFASSFPIGVFPASSNPSARTNATLSGWLATLLGVGIVKPYSIPEADWQASVSVSTTGSTTLLAAGGAGVKNYVTALQLSGNAALVANTVQVLSGATVIWGPHTIPAATPFLQIMFPTPLQGGAAAALNVQLGTTPVGALEVTAQGYAAAD